MVFLLDILTKTLVIHNLAPGETLPIWPGVFHITRLHNTGAAFSMFYNYPTLLTVVAGLLLFVFTVYMLVKKQLHRTEILGFSSIIGGAAGNLLDRVQSGAVTDFLDFILIHYPVFNLADSFICIGVILLVWHHVRSTPHASGT